MQDTPVITSASVPVPFTVLRAHFATLPDPRRGQGRRFPLPALLTLAVAAILANHLTVLAIAEWGAALSEEMRHALGFTKGWMPHQTTLHRLFARLDAALLTATLSAALAVIACPDRTHRGAQSLAVDGKSHRGRLAGQALEGTGSPIHMLSAFCHASGLVLAQMPVTACGDKAAAERATAPLLLARLDWQGRVLTGDALYCQRSVCQQVRDAGGDYLVSVKRNQPELHDAIAALFAARAETALNAASLPAQDMRQVVTRDYGHGRVERRTLIASTELHDYLDWPDAAQVFMLERQWWERGAAKRSIQYGVTSLPRTVADAADLLTCKRGHWRIENTHHYVKDVVLGEDASQTRVGQGPNVLAALRDTALNLLRASGSRTIAARLRHYARSPTALLPLLGLAPP